MHPRSGRAGHLLLVAFLLLPLAPGGAAARRPEGRRLHERLLIQPPGSAQPPPTTQPPLAPLVITQLEERAPDDLASPRTFSLKIAEPMRVTELLLFMLQGTTYGLVPDPDVGGTFVGELKDVTLRQALDLVLHPQGLDYSVAGTSIRVFRRKLETRMLDVNGVLTSRVMRRTLSAGSAPLVRPGDPGSIDTASGSSVHLTASDEVDVADELRAGVQSLLSDQGRFHLDRKAGVLQVTDYPDRLDKVTLYLQAIQSRLERQVLIAARVLEVELAESAAAAVDWTGVLGAEGVVEPGSAPTELGSLLGLRLRDFGALVDALARQGRVRVLASPHVVTMHNQAAIMRVGTQEVFFAPGEAGATTLAAAGRAEVIAEGLVLIVTPQIGADGVVTMSLRPRVTERARETRTAGGGRTPLFSVRETDTVVRLHAGETVVIGGLTELRPSVREARVPVLGSVPGLGGLFRREEPAIRRFDLVILLTPTVVTPATVAAAAEAAGRLLQGVRRP